MGLLNRLRALLPGPAGPELTVDTADLVVVAEAFDLAEADSAVLARSPGLPADRPAVLRHHLSLPDGRVDEAAAVLAQDGWVLRRTGPAGTDTGTTGARLHALRVQRLDALHCAQERARLAGLAQRLDGDWFGWDALVPGAWLGREQGG